MAQLKETTIQNKLSLNEQSSGHATEIYPHLAGLMIGSNNTDVNNSSYYSLVIGKNNKIKYSENLICGINNTSISYNNLMVGEGLNAERNFQTVLGCWSAPDQDALFKIGYGNSDTQRKNVFQIQSDGYIKNTAGMSLANGNFRVTGGGTIVDGIVDENCINYRGEYGSRDLQGDISAIDAARASDLSPNRLAGMPDSQFKFERSTDAGATWSVYTSVSGKALCTKDAAATNGNTPTSQSVNNYHRITIDFAGYLYAQLVKLLINFSSQGAGGCTCKIEFGDYSKTTVWATYKTVPINGWSAWNSIGINRKVVGNSEYGNIRYMRLTFQQTSLNANYYSNSQVISLRLYSDQCWSSPSILSSTGLPIQYDENLNISFPAEFSGKLKFNQVSGNGTILLRDSTNRAYSLGINYRTDGTEAACFETKNPDTSFIFRTYDPNTVTAAWNEGVPSMQIKNQRVTINKLIANNTNAAYNLDVNGTLNANTLYENGTLVSEKYAGINHTHTKADVGLGNVDNTADADKIVARAAELKASYTGDGGQVSPSIVTKTAICRMMNGFKGLTTPNLSGYMDTIIMNAYGWWDVPYATAIGIQKTSGVPRAWIASGGNAENWSNVTELVTGNNIKEFTCSLKTDTDNRNSATTPEGYRTVLNLAGLKYNSVIGSPSTDTYSSVIGYGPWGNNSNGDLFSHEFAINNTGLYHRREKDASSNTWGDWDKIPMASETVLNGDIVSAVNPYGAKEVHNTEFENVFYKVYLNANVSGQLYDFNDETEMTYEIDELLPLFDGKFSDSTAIAIPEDYKFSLTINAAKSNENFGDNSYGSLLLSLDGIPASTIVRVYETYMDGGWHTLPLSKTIRNGSGYILKFNNTYDTVSHVEITIKAPEAEQISLYQVEFIPSKYNSATPIVKKFGDQEMYGSLKVPKITVGDGNATNASQTGSAFVGGNLQITVKNDNYGLMPSNNNYNQIGSTSLYWYRSYITNGNFKTVIVENSPTADNHAANKKYVDQAITNNKYTIIDNKKYTMSFSNGVLTYTYVSG